MLLSLSKFFFQILETENAYSGSLAFGVTSCDPITIPTSSLPLDSDELLNRPEYWVGIKDVAAQPKVLDELSFWITDKGFYYCLLFCMVLLLSDIFKVKFTWRRTTWLRV